MKMALDNFTLLLNQIHYVCFFYEKNNQGNQDIFTEIVLSSKHGGAEVGEMAKVLNISFEKSGPNINNGFIKISLATKSYKSPKKMRNGVNSLKRCDPYTN